ncbi:MAG: L-seryl-tRNA(Sec) selenium transferase [Acidimicrobiia bacterium]
MLRHLPSVDGLIREIDSPLPVTLVTEVARRAIDEARELLTAGESADARELAAAKLSRLELTRPQAVVNATGVLLHTNLGRAPLAPAAALAAQRAATGYGNLEFDLATGRRGGRGAYVQDLLCSLTGAEAAAVVGNNAGALLLTLAAIGGTGEVPVSRGELIEIGGSYRLPELMGAGRARMVEVGTTNRTRKSDYQRAVTAETSLLLKVHPSNYRVMGFAEDTPLDDLVDVGHTHSVPVAFDIGSGLLDAGVPWLEGAPPAWLKDEPGVRQALATGVDIVTFSGDKLVGGPQAGIIVGSREAVTTMTTHPIARALRIDGPNLAALAVTLELYADGRGGEIPFWEMATRSDEELRTRLEMLQAAVGGEIRQASSVPGAGSVPGAELPTPVLAVDDVNVDAAWDRLLTASPPIVARRDAGVLIIDLRAVPIEADGAVLVALEAACR